MHSFLYIICVSILLAGGCASFESQLVHRDPCNTKWEHVEADGIPITVSVPTHIDLQIVQESWFHHGQPFPSEHDPLITIRVEHSIVATDRLFTIDPKRPAAGTARPVINLKNQYPDLISSQVNDQTIQEIGAAIARLNNSGGFPAVFGSPASEKSLTDAGNIRAQLFRVDSVLAARRFDLEALI